MSTRYRLDVEITRYNHDRADALQHVLRQEWEMTETKVVLWKCEDTVRHFMVSGYGTDDLDESVEIEDFLEHLTNRLWSENGGYCRVQYTVTFVEQAPTESFDFGVDEFTRWKEKKDADGE